MPYENRMSNYIDLYNELILLAAFGATIAINTKTFSAFTVNIVGWTLIPLVLFSLVVIWAIMMPPAVRELVRMLLGLCRRGPEGQTEQAPLEKKGSETEIESPQKKLKEEEAKVQSAVDIKVGDIEISEKAESNKLTVYRKWKKRKAKRTISNKPTTILE